MGDIFQISSDRIKIWKRCLRGWENQAWGKSFWGEGEN